MQTKIYIYIYLQVDGSIDQPIDLMCIYIYIQADRINVTVFVL